jgi:hypothetical protein
MLNVTNQESLAEVYQYLHKLEIELHQTAVRHDMQQLDDLLHDEFIEIGYSGVVYNKADIKLLLLGEAEIKASVWSQAFTFSELSKNLIQIRYKEARLSNNGELSRHAYRSSIWQNSDNCWQIRFHQATAIPPFVKI